MIIFRSGSNGWYLSCFLDYQLWLSFNFVHLKDWILVKITLVELHEKVSVNVRGSRSDIVRPGFSAAIEDKKWWSEGYHWKKCRWLTIVSCSSIKWLVNKSFSLCSVWFRCLFLSWACNTFISWFHIFLYELAHNLILLWVLENDVSGLVSVLAWNLVGSKLRFDC